MRNAGTYHDFIAFGAKYVCDPLVSAFVAFPLYFKVPCFFPPNRITKAIEGGMEAMQNPTSAIA